MAKIRHIHIENFRAVKELNWFPDPGINCIIGPSDAGKSTIIEAIDLTLGPRRTKVFSDVDFHLLNTDEPIQISITVGDLADPLQNFEKYDLFLRGYDKDKCEIVEEAGQGIENVLTLRLRVGNDLDPVWSLYSERAEAQGREKNITWGDRVLLAGTRIGSVADYHLSWRKGAVLNRIGDETPNTNVAIAQAKRAAMKAFGQEAQPNLKQALIAVSESASELGVDIEGDLQALLNAHSISLSGGTIAVHDSNGLPLSSLGLGSNRLLVAGLLDKAKVGSNLILVDEIEHGLEPHRIIRFLSAIGAKDTENKYQSFVTSHSPVVIRELSADQLFRLCPSASALQLLRANVDAGSQGALRSAPEAFLAKSVLLCEGASEVGFLRGLDQCFSKAGNPSIFAKGVTLVDVGGVSKLYSSAPTLLDLSFRVAAFRDDDVSPDQKAEMDFLEKGAALFKWAPGEKLEAAIINGIDDSTLLKIMDYGASCVGEQVAADHLASVSNGQSNFAKLKANAQLGGAFSTQERAWLTAASTTKNGAWFKSVSRMETLASSIIGPDYGKLNPEFKQVIDGIFTWAYSGE